MSALTKVFVVMHVVLSMVLTAGLVVFVNRTEDFKKLNEATTAKLATANRQYADSQAEIQVVRGGYEHKLNDKQAEATALRQALETAQSQINEGNAKVAELTSNVAQLTASNGSVGEALKVAQDANSKIQTNYAELRKGQDALQKQFTEANLHINDIQNKLDVTERQRRQVTEENTQLTTDLQKAQDLIHRSGIDSAQATQDVNPTSTVNINGVIRDKKLIQGVPYATISIGSADAVKKNMQFKVVDQNQFLGYLTVDTVEPHEATGRLDGPRVADIKKGAEVRTQL